MVARRGGLGRSARWAHRGGHSFLHRYVLGSERINGLLKPRAVALLETAKWLIETRKENRQGHTVKMVSIAARLGWATRDDRDESGKVIDGIVDDYVAFVYDAEKAGEIAAAARAKDVAKAEGAAGGADEAGGEAAAAAALQLCTSEGGELKDGDEGGEGGEGGEMPTLSKLKVDEEAAPKPKPKPKRPDAVGGGKGEVCAITGAPAKYVGGHFYVAAGRAWTNRVRLGRYRDPISGLPYADLAAFRELRKLHPDPKARRRAHIDLDHSLGRLGRGGLRMAGAVSFSGGGEGAGGGGGGGGRQGRRRGRRGEDQPGAADCDEPGRNEPPRQQGRHRAELKDAPPAGGLDAGGSRLVWIERGARKRSASCRRAAPSQARSCVVVELRARARCE